MNTLHTTNQLETMYKFDRTKQTHRYAIDNGRTVGMVFDKTKVQ